GRAPDGDARRALAEDPRDRGGWQPCPRRDHHLPPHDLPVAEPALGGDRAGGGDRDHVARDAAARPRKDRRDAGRRSWPWAWPWARPAARRGRARRGFVAGGQDWPAEGQDWPAPRNARRAPRAIAGAHGPDRPPRRR